jgi:hypothetical protein
LIFTKDISVGFKKSFNVELSLVKLVSKTRKA